MIYDNTVSTNLILFATLDRVFGPLFVSTHSLNFRRPHLYIVVVKVECFPGEHLYNRTAVINGRALASPLSFITIPISCIYRGVAFRVIFLLSIVVHRYFEYFGHSVTLWKFINTSRQIANPNNVSQKFPNNRNFFSTYFYHFEKKIISSETKRG